MLKFMQKRQGAISIFLVIILLPMLCIGSVMVDMSRIKLARSVAVSAGDLTLNTALSCYDNVLKEMYGLMASSQDYDSLMGNLEDYYKRTVQSAGLSNGEADDYVNKIMNELTGIGVSGDVTSLLHMEVTDFTDTQREEASLANPALLKSQIVNFMKYRGPIEFGLGFLDSIKSFSTIGEQLEVIEAKQEYYEARQTVVENCENGWRNIRAYNELQITEANFIEWHTRLNYLKSEYSFVNKNLIRDYYGAKGNFDADNHTYAVDYSSYFDFYWKGKLVNATVKGANEMTPYVQAMDNAMTSFTTELNSDISKKMCLGETDNVYDIKQVIYYQKYVNDGKGYPKAAHELYKAYNKFATAKASLDQYIIDKDNELLSTKSSLESTKSSLESAESTLSSLQSQLSTAKEEDKAAILSSISSVQSSISSYSSSISAYEKKIQELEADIEEKKGWQAMTFNGKSLNSLLSDYSSYYNTNMRSFSKITHGMSLVINGSKTRSYKYANRTFQNKAELVEGGFSNEHILSVRANEMSELHTRLTKGKLLLVAAKVNLEFVSTQLSSTGKLKLAEGNWKGKASVEAVAGTTVSEQNLSELDSVKEFINKEDVDNLLSHIDGALSTVDVALSELEAYQYGNTMIKDIDHMDKVVTAVNATEYGAEIANIRANETDLDELEDKVFMNIYHEPTTILTHKWDTENQHPELEKGDHKFYNYLKQLFDKIVEEGGELETKKKDAEEVQKNTEDKLESYTKVKDEETEVVSESEKFTYSGKNLPSYQWNNGLKEQLEKHNQEAVEDYKSTKMSSGNMKGIEGEAGKSGGSMAAFFKELGDAVKNLGLDLRDNLFITGYIMAMFSYDTFENEKIWEAKGSKTSLMENPIEQKKIEVNGKAYKTACYDADGNFQNAGADELTAGDLASLTGVAISPQNNAAYLSEVEYIVYGTNSTTAPYGTIYAIRAGFNIVYAFSDTQISSMAQGIATAIFGVPPLTFMVPIAKAAIIIGVALAESALDIVCLKAGMAIPIYKTKETWMLSVQNLVDGVVGDVKQMAAEKLKKKVETLVDYGSNRLNEWLDMTDQQMKEIVESGSLEAQIRLDNLGNAVSDSLTKEVEQYVGTAVDQVIILCEESKTMIRNGAFLGDDDRIVYIEEKLVNWLSNDATSKGSIMYKAKAKAVEFLISRGEVKNILLELQSIEEAGITKVEGKIDEVSSTLIKTKDTLLEQFNTRVNDMVNELTAEVIQVEEEINEYISKASESAKNAVNQGSKALKETINQSIGELMGSTSDADMSFVNTNVTASLYSFQYSDYLQVFLVIALMINQEGVLLRTADVIQTNAGLAKNGETQLGELNTDNPTGYQLKKAYTYVELEATIEVKPLFMNLPFVLDHSSEEIKKNKNWYTIEYRGVQGY